VRKDFYNKKEPTLCDFNAVNTHIPRVRLLKLAWQKNFIQADDAIFLKALRWRVEAAINKLLHVLSLIDKALLKVRG
jgi:hypothetical protein